MNGKLDFEMNIEEKKQQLIKKFSDIREKSIWIPEQTKGTIDPKYIEYQNTPGFMEIKGNSNGPIDIDGFLMSDCRVLYILKESFIEEESFKNGDRGGHNQADEYKGETFETLDNPTYRNMIGNVYSSIRLRPFVDSDETVVQDANQLFKTNLCVLNVNYFPAIIEKNSTEKLIHKWSEVNEDLITEIIKICEPTIIIGGSTIQPFYHDHNPDTLMGKIFGQDINVLPNKKLRSDFCYPKRWSKDFFYNENMIIMNQNHPAYRASSKKYWDAERCRMIDVIKWWNEKIKCTK